MEWSFDYNGLFDKDNGEKKDKTMKKPKSKKKKKHINVFVLSQN